ncbi:MAG: thiolase family protein [Candidatus Marsarchaeota archaeon]|nr:thiolase family protein [Candidatus Marsarchaeota archaeon]
MEEAYVVVAFRSPVGKFMGKLSDLSAVQIAAEVAKGTFERSGIDGKLIDEVIMGNVLSAGEGQNPAKQVVMHSGIQKNAATVNVNMICASGLKAMALAAQGIKSDDLNIALAGGMESMTNAPHTVKGVRSFRKYGNVDLKELYSYSDSNGKDYLLIDEMINTGLWDCYADMHMGTIAEMIGTKYSITREEQDRFAYDSHMKAAAAVDSGKFKAETIPIKLKDDVFSSDEGIRRDTSIEKLAKLKPAFAESGTVTAGNSSQLSDGAAIAIIASKRMVEEHGFKPIAKIESYADSGIDPNWYGLSPIDSMNAALKKSGHTLEEMDLIEINEAFCVQTLGVAKEMNIDMEKLNVNGGATALGHPLGATGAILLTKVVHALADRKKELGIISLCHGGGGSSSMVVSRV